MNLKSRWLYSLFALSVLVTLLAAQCGAPPATEAPKPTEAPQATEPTEAPEATEAAEEPAEEITLSVFTQAPGAYPTIFPVIIENFEAKHPGVTVDMRVVGYGEYQSSLASMIAAGEAPDVFLENQGGDLWGVAQAGEALDLTPYMDANDSEWRKQMYDYIPDLLSWDGNVYAVAASLNNLQVGVNKGMLEEYGLAMPESTEDLISMAGELEGTGVAPVAFATADLWGAVDMFVLFVQQQGGGEILAKADAGEEPWSGNPIFINSMRTIKELTDAGVFMEGASAMNYHEDALPVWIQGNTVMLWPVGNFMIQDIPPDMDADAMWFPAMTDSESVLTGGTALVWVASSKTEHPDLAVELLKELTTQETYEVMFENGVAPAGPLEKDVTSAYPLADKVNSQQGSAMDRFIYTPEVYQEVGVAVQSVMAGDMTPEEAVDHIQATADGVCGVSEPAAEKPAEEVTLSVFTQAPGAYPTIFPVIIENFEAKHPGVTVDMRVVGYGEYQSSLASMIAAGEAPDVFLENQGGDLWGVAQAGEALDLTPYMDANDSEWRKQMYDYIPDLLSWDGNVYAVAASLNNLQVGVNKGMLEEYGLAMPESTEDLISMAGELEGTGVAPVAFATADLWGAVDMFVLFVQQQGGGEILAKADAGEEPWSGNPIFINSMRTIKELTDAGVFMEGASAMNYHEDALPVWIQGNTVMLWPVGNFMIQDIPPDMDADAMWFPAMTDSESVLTGGTALVWVASSKTEHPDLAVELLKELTTQETYEVMFENGVAPAGPLEKDVTSAYPLADKVNSQQGSAMDRFIYTPEVYQEVGVAVQSVMAGDMTPEEAVDHIQATADSVFK